jgi:hypothetical protein
VVNSDDAVRLAAVTGMVRRGASMDSAMQKLGFDAATRAKIEPRARQILGAEHGLIHLKIERDKTGTQSMSMSIDTKMSRLVIEKDGGLWRSMNNSAAREQLPSVVRSVLRQAQELGLTQVEIRRPSADLPHGHEYWARIGFTGIAKDSAMMLKLSKSQSTGVAIKDIGPLIDMPSGRQLWKEAGTSSVSLVFDLKSGSDSWRRLDARSIKGQQN